MAKSKNECFESVKRLLVEESWTHLDGVSNLVCNLLDDSLRLACEKDVSHGHASPISGVDERKEVAALFFAFVKYFATSLTRKSVRRDYGDPETNDTSTLNESVFNTTKVRTPQTQGKASSSHMQSVASSFSFPPIRELWRQPSLIAAMERLAEAIWKIQVNVHNGESNVEDFSVGRCPLCYAASIENVIGTDAIWSLLEFYVAYRLAEGLSSDKEETKMNANRIDYSVDKSYDTMITLDVYTRQLLWTHAIAVCRNAIWNGAVQTLCLSVKEWLYAGTHPLLFAMVVVSPHGEGSVGLEVGKDIFTSRSFFLIQMCLLIQDEVMFEMEAIDARVKSDPFCKDQKRQKKNEDTSSVIIEKGHSKENTNNDTINDDDGVLSQVSSLTLRERGDVELHDSLFTLREMARVTGNMTAFAALTTTTPHYVMDGMTLLDWVCEKGYECCVRLLLSTWVKAYRDVRLLPDAAMGAEESVEEKRLRVNFAETLEKDLPKEVKKLTNVASKAVRCTVLQSNATVLPHAVQSGNVSIVRQLFLYGASRHQWDGGEPENKEMFAVLCNPGSVLDRTVGGLHERTREALCATAASDALANAAWRLWSEKVRNLVLSKWANSEEETEYKRSHDSIMRTSLAALEFDPHNPLARKTLRDVLARKVIDSRNLDIATCGGDAALQQKRYYVTARRMCEQLLMTHTQREREKEIESVLESLPFASGAPETRKTTMTSDNLFFLSSSSTDGSGDVSGGGGSPATIATDEQQRPVYALVNLIDTMESGTTNPTAMMHPLWVRLPCGVNVQRSFELVGGLYGVVESVLPLHAPVECGDLVLFALRQKFFRFDVTRVVRPRDGVVVEVPCVLEGSKDKVETSVLRCAVVPTPVYNFDDDRAAMDPLHWLENISERPNDAIEQILNNRQYLQRWMHIVQLGHRSLWFHDIPVTPSRSSVWRINQACNRPNEHLIFAQTAFPFLVGKGDDDMDDPFGLTSESVFALEPQEMNVMKTNAAFRVMGVFPAWGWEGMFCNDQDGATRRFLQHFFSILDAREQQQQQQQTASVTEGEKEEVTSLLQIGQRTAIGKLLPEWIRLLLLQTPKGGSSSDDNSRLGGASCVGSSSYLDSDMAERWFAFPHLALIPSLWVTQNVPPPCGGNAHYRLLSHLQRRYEGKSNEGGTRRVFMDDFLRFLSQRCDTDGRGVERMAFMNAVESLFLSDRSGKEEEQQQQQPPVALVAAALFCEWCALAEGDASFASARVPLKVIADDLSAYASSRTTAKKERDEDKDGDVENGAVVVGTLTGLACAYPMTIAARGGGSVAAGGQQSLKRERGESVDDYDDDEEDEFSSDGDDAMSDYDYGVGGEEEEENGNDNNDNNNSDCRSAGAHAKRARRRWMNSFIKRNTTTFRVPLASVVLNVFRVTHDGTGDAVMERHVTPAHTNEAHCRRGELLWHTVGESKRHRRFLESKGFGI